MNLLVAALAGLGVGLILGAMGGGGAIITVPILTYALGMTTDQATTGSLIIVGLSSLVAAVPHFRGGRVSWGTGLVFAILGALGTIPVALVASRFDPNWRMAGFGLLLVLVATLMLRGSRQAAASDVPRPSLREPRTLAVTALAAVGVGALTGFFGVGGGFAIIPALTLVLGFGMPLAVGTSLLIIGLNSATALSGRLAGGVDLDWPVIALFTLTAMVGSIAGSQVTERVSPVVLKRAFAVLLLVVAAYTLVRSGLAIAG